jgi:hypothetical protein
VNRWQPQSVLALRLALVVVAAALGFETPDGFIWDESI